MRQEELGRKVELNWIYEKQKYFIPVILSVALFVAILWLICKPEFEPAITAIALLGSLLSIYIDRNLSTQEKRRETIRGLIFELGENALILRSEKFNFTQFDSKIILYPRFGAIVAQAAITSGLFTNSKDERLYLILGHWVKIANDFNRRIEVTENTMSQLQKDSPEIARIKEKVIKGKAMASFSEEFKKYAKHLVEKYWKESGLSEESEHYEKLRI